MHEERGERFLRERRDRGAERGGEGGRRGVGVLKEVKEGVCRERENACKSVYDVMKRACPLWVSRH
jgi:hypothetical protein